MLPLISPLRFYLYLPPTDMRNSFDGLSGLVTNSGIGAPTNGDVYVFINRRRDRLKMLVWERTGFWLFCKRLEQGTFQLPTNSAQQVAVELSYEVLLLLLEGIDYTQLKRRRRYQPQREIRPI
jgi:transposase